MPDYRWSYYLTAPWELVDEWYRVVKFGVRNLIQWFPVIWGESALLVLGALRCYSAQARAHAT